ncbi:MAG: hypothetical protein MUD00_02960 [Candidatus Pacebacteria bacterium]|jgi:hypothetical protein|nr:hypothetical protein [Candidatus Paceibacterota bacterium]
MKKQKKTQKIVFPRDEEILKEIFWEKAIDHVSATMLSHCMRAHALLRRMTMQ